MAIHYNTATLKNLSDFWRLKGDALPSELIDDIQPVFDVTPPSTLCRSQTASNTGSAQTIYATPTDQDFYLTSASLSLIKDVTSTSTGTNIRVTIDGVARIILAIASITLTVQQAQMSQSFSNPIKVDRGTNITVEHSAGVANVLGVATIQGFLI